MPPSALMSAAAWSTPFFICAPVAALGPVIGAPTPILTCACAAPAKARAKPSATPCARPSVIILFIRFPLVMNGPAILVAHALIGKAAPTFPQHWGNVTSGLPAAPAQKAGRRDEPAILRDHLRGAGGTETEEAEGDADRAVDKIIMERQQRAAEHTEMDKAHPDAKNEAVEDNLPRRPPGLGDGAPGQRSGAAAEHDADREENPQRVLVEQRHDHAVRLMRSLGRLRDRPILLPAGPEARCRC